MKHANYLTLTALVVLTSTAGAQEVGRVISVQPIIQQVAIPQQVCNTRQVEVPQQKSGAGAVMGAIAGGAIGNTLGKGAGNAAATMLGIMGGAVLGDHIEGSGPAQYQSVQNCSNRNIVENRTVAYNVTYEYNGKQYTTQMQQDPGKTIELQVSPAGMSGSPSSANQAESNSTPAVVYQQSPAVVYQQAPVVIAPGTYYSPYYSQGYGSGYYSPPVRLNFDFDYWGGRHHWH